MKGFPRRSKLTDESPRRVLFELRPASELSTAALAQLFTAGYEGYELPIQVDEAAFAAMARLSDFDLDLSRLALRQGTPVGICVIGARGDEGWIGGLGVVPSSRRHGVGRRLMDAVLEAARAAAIGRVSLEVLERNAGAIALYDRLGFKGTRMLEVWSLSAEAGASGAATESVSTAAEWIRANRRVPDPWQRADQSVENVVRDGAEVEAVSLPGCGAVLFRVSGQVASVLQLAARDVDSAAELLAAVRRRGRSLRFVNVPAGDPAAEALRKLGGDLELRQLEMALALDAVGTDTTGLDR